jgi:very-short-patch-repair endonuclease
VYGSTDPQTFIQAVHELPEQTRKLLRVRFIGRIETAAYAQAGYHVVRFWNHDVLGNIEGVLESLVQELNFSR